MHPYSNLYITYYSVNNYIFQSYNKIAKDILWRMNHLEERKQIPPNNIKEYNE